MMRFVIALILAWMASSAARAAEIAVALTEDEVAVDAGFTGARVTLFGVVEGLPEEEARASDIIAVVRGPAADFQIRRMQKENLFWLPGPVITLKDAPGLYLTSATRPIADIAPIEDRQRFGLGAEHANITPAFAPRNADAAAVLEDVGAAALIRAYAQAAHVRGAFRNDSDGIAFVKGTLFTIAVDLPADTPVGFYAATVYFYRGGELLDQDDATLSVRKVGVERRIYDLAHGRPVAYGLMCVVAAFLAGWLASIAFRK
ncbi:MAG: TIGR02186 family protein [Parvularculaceae bacterium]